MQLFADCSTWEATAQWQGPEPSKRPIFRHFPPGHSGWSGCLTWQTCLSHIPLSTGCQHSQGNATQPQTQEFTANSPPPGSPTPLWWPQGLREMKGNSSSSPVWQGPWLLVLSHGLRLVPLADYTRKWHKTHRVRPQISKRLWFTRVHFRAGTLGDGRCNTAQPAQSPSSFKKREKETKTKTRTSPNKVMPHAVCGFQLLSTPGSCDTHGSLRSVLVQASPERMRTRLWCASGDYKWIGNMLCWCNSTFSWLTTLASRPSSRLLPAGLLLRRLRLCGSSQLALHAHLLSPNRHKLLEPVFLLFHPAMLITGVAHPAITQ